jgi:hypothetical protein
MPNKAIEDTREEAIREIAKATLETHEVRSALTNFNWFFDGCL